MEAVAPLRGVLERRARGLTPAWASRGKSVPRVARPSSNEVWKVNWTWVQAPLETDAAGEPAGDQDLRLPLLDDQFSGLVRSRSGVPSQRNAGRPGSAVGRDLAG